MNDVPDDSRGPRHPPAFRLDAVAAGDADEGVTAHITSCSACAGYVMASRGAAESFRANNDAGAFVARASARARPRGALPGKSMWMAAPLLAAAGVLLLLRASPKDHAKGSPEAPPGASIDLHFKGGVAGTIIRERDGRQERLTAPIHVRAGDRLRLEVSTDRAQAMAAGLLAEDGTWIPLLTPTWLDIGTHYSDLAARFDDSGTRATLLLGPPEAIERARHTHDFEGLMTWPVTSEP